MIGFASIQNLSAHSKNARASQYFFTIIDTTLSLTTDASDTAIGAALNEVSISDQNRPQAVFSRRLTQTERKYSTFELEMLSIYAAIIKLRYLIELKKL